MAEIYLARHEGFGGFARTVVVKRMLPQLAVRPDFVQMFLDEARLAANLNHPNIVSVFNLGEVPNLGGVTGPPSYFIAMEFVDGPHLGSLFAHSLRMRKPLPIELCAYIVARAADGLHYAHEHNDPATGLPLNIVHRDISPQNILVSRQGDVKVTDFGVAKASTQQTKTRTGIIKGKVAYMSPEQCLGEVVDRRTDVFALGIVLYELLTRRRLFRDKSDLLIMQKITGEDVAAPSTVNRELDAELDAICARALSRARDGRFRDASELAEAIDAWLVGRKGGDARAQLHRWFEAHAVELSLGADEGSQPSVSVSATARVRPTSPGEATSATPSLNSAETVMRFSSTGSRPATSTPSAEVTDRQSPAATERFDSSVTPEDPAGDQTARARPPRPAERAAAAETLSMPSTSSKNVRPPLAAADTRAEDALPQRHVDDDAGEEPTQRAPRPADEDAATARMPAAGGAAFSADDGPAFASDDAPAAALAEPLARVDQAPARRPLPMAALVGGGALALVLAVVGGVAIASRGGDDGDGEVATNAGDAGPGALASDDPGGDKDDSAAARAAMAAQMAAQSAKLVIDSEPPVELLVDGKSIGVAPQTVAHAAGHVKVQALFTDQAPITEERDVAAGEELAVHLVGKVELVVKSTPPGARVFIDGTPEGITPYDRPGRVKVGKSVTLRLALGGYAPFEKVETPEPGKPLVVDAALERAAAPVLVEKHAQKPGTLKMRSTPWVNVKVASTGAKFSTPNAVQVPGGTQRLILSNPEQNLNDTLVVTIPEERELRVDLVYEQQKSGAWKLKSKQIR